MPRVSYEDLQGELLRVLLEKGFEQDRAALCARLFAEASRDGIYSHGLNRFPRFIEMIDRSVVDVHAVPTQVRTQGVLEQWNGRRGAGNVNAFRCMSRAVALAREQGMGCVALQNTNHWMRGGSYGWQAAEAGVIGLCWTNTMPNLPPWGARESRLGNNPLVIAVPRSGGHIVLDMALSQFSYGTLASYGRRGELLPVEGGYDEAGRLTRDPGAIEASGRPLPAGFWKGSGLALLLDLLAALLAGGQATHQIPSGLYEETGLSQVFIAFELARLYGDGQADRVADEIIASMHEATPASEDGRVYYPGEQTLQRRKENMDKGVPVDPSIWQEVQAMC